jgi:hypothetical protein
MPPVSIFVGVGLYGLRILLYRLLKTLNKGNPLHFIGSVSYSGIIVVSLVFTFLGWWGVAEVIMSVGTMLMLDSIMYLMRETMKFFDIRVPDQILGQKLRLVDKQRWSEQARFLIMLFGIASLITILFVIINLFSYV